MNGMDDNEAKNEEHNEKENQEVIQPDQPAEKNEPEWVEEERKRLIKECRISLMVSAIIILVFSVISWMVLQAEISEVEANPYMTVNEEKVDMALYSIYFSIGLGILFVGFFDKAKSKPADMTQMALTIYAALLVISGFIEPKSILAGWLGKMIIIGSLINGVRAGLEFKIIKKKYG